MKKYLLALFMTMVLWAGFSQLAVAQHFYVKVRPAPVVVVRPPAPSPRHVWVEDEWAWRGGTYVRVGGHWELPPRRHHIWVAGRWVHEGNHGHYWVPGHWR